MASDGAGTIVVFHNSGTLGVSTDNGVTWTATPFEDSVCNVSYVNGKFIISTYKGFIITSDDGISWSWVQIFSSDEPNFYHVPRQTAIARWKYGNGMYVGSGGMEGNLKCYFYSYDLKTFEVIFSTDNGSYYMYDHIWDAANERWTFFTDSGLVLYVTEFNYDETTYFQFPYVAGDHMREHGKEWYIRVR
jgi:hypothetical protein